MMTCTTMYAIPADRTMDARGATANLSVVIAGPVETAGEPPVSRWWTLPVGHMGTIIGSGAKVYVNYQLRNDEGDRRFERGARYIDCHIQRSCR